MSYKAKRIVIGVAVAAALFTVASVGTYFYIKGNESAQATENTEQTVNQNNENTTDTQNNNPQPTTRDQNNDQESPAPTPRTTTTNDADGTTTRTTINEDGTTTTIRMNNDGTTTTTVRNPDGTIATQTTDANVITEYEEGEERLVSRDDWVGWTPEAVPVPVIARVANELSINKYKINVEKEVISKDSNEDGKYDLGETITYQVKISNIGNTKLTGIKISDKINDRENIKSMLLIDENNVLMRKIEDISEYAFDLEAGESAYFEYTYIVNEEDILEGTVKNVVIAENDKVREKDNKEVPTSDISKDFELKKSTKSKPENNIFYVLGEKIIYDVEVTNKGNITLDVKVKDPITEEKEVTINIAPGETKNVEFTHIVTAEDVDATKVINVATGEVENEDPKPSNPQEDPVNEYISVNVEKIWEDNDNQDGYRPESINVQLLANGEEKGEQVTLNDENNWKYSWTELFKKENEKDINYTVKEIAVDKYETTITGDYKDKITITNTHIPETTSLTGNKKWEDNDNQDGKRPESIKIILNKQIENGEVQEAGNQIITAEDNWTYNFENIPVYESGKILTYSISEEAVEGYTMQIDGNNIINTHIPETFTIEGEKTWVDADNQDGIRPKNITVKLFKGENENKTEVSSKEVSSDSQGKWKYKFENLPKFENGNEIKYSIEENDVEGYKKQITENNIINTHIPEKITINGEKIWEDNNNQDGKRPDSVTIRVLANGVEVESKAVTAEENWKYNFTNLDKYSNGKEIEYTVIEDAVEGYETRIEGYNVINTHEVEKININGTKTWEDNNNQDGKRPESIKIVLNKKIEDKTTQVTTKTVQPDENGIWSYKFENLPVYEKGKKVEYSIDEEKVPEYETIIDGYNITNTHIPETLTIEGEKTWVDADNQDGIRPKNITVKLFKGENENKTEVSSKEVSSDSQGKWKYKFENLPKFENGNEIKYSIEENDVEGYKKQITENNIINTHIPEKITINGEKIWEDNNNQDGKRPDSVTIRVLANGVEVESKAVTAEENWKYNFTNLDKYSNGKEIEYTVIEDAVEGYETRIEGYNVINTHEVEKININGTKTWEDNNNQDGKRPESIKIVLNKKIEDKTTQVTTKTVQPDENGIWSYKFENLPVYEKGKKVEYSIDEEKVPEYETIIDGYNITNTHIPETLTIEGEKTWVDADNQDGLRPQSIIVKLIKGENDNKIEVSSKEISSDSQGKWTYKFENLPKYENGSEIKYSIEENPVEGYKQRIVGTDIINTHVPEMMTISGEKTWEDAENRDGKRPEYITIKLYKEVGDNKTLITSKQISPNSEGKWLYSFEDLPKYENGSEIKYILEEVNIDGYTKSFDGYNLTNTHNPETTSISAKKIWEDKDDLLKLRPESVDFNLVIDGVVSNQKLTANESNNWQVTFNDLSKYKDQGTEIKYNIIEERITGYKEPVYGTENGVVTITNTIDYPSVNIEKNAEKIKAVDGNNFEDIIKDEQGNITTKVNSVGDIIKYEIIAENDGTQVLNNVNIVDQNHNVKVLKITKGTDVYEDTGKEANITAGNNLLAYLPDGVEYKLEPNEKYIIEIEYVVENINNTATIDNIAEITARADNEDVTDNDDEKIPVTQVINNSIEKTSVKVGNTTVTDENRETIKLKKDDVITYEIKVSNLGNVDLTGVKVTDDHNVTISKIEKLNDDGSRTNQSDLVRTATSENLLGKDVLEADTTYIITVTYVVPDNEIDEETENGDKIINNATITTNEIPEKSDDDTLTKNSEAIINMTKTSRVLNKENGNNTVYEGDIIEYTITVSNDGNISGSATVKDSDLKDNINNEKVTLMNGRTELNKTESLTTKCINVSSNKSDATTINVNQLANGYEIPSIDNGERIVITFRVKVGKLLPGETIVNTLADQENTHTQNDIEASINLNKKLLKPQNVVLVIDLSLSMAEDVNYHGTQDPMADTYQKTRWYALTQALDKFLNTYMKDGNPAGNTVTIIGYNNEAKNPLVTNTTSLSAAKASYANVFTEQQYNMITGEDKNDVDNLTEKNTGTLLGSGTNIQGGLRKASDILGNNAKGSKVILMTDGEANRSLDANGNPTGSGDHVERAISEATALKTKGITLYTVALSVGVDNQTYTNRLINMASEDENGDKLAKSADDMQSLVDYFENVSEVLSELHVTGTTENGILYLSDSISIDSRYVKNVEITIPNNDGINQPITITWAEFTNYYNATAKTINIKQLASDKHIKGITGTVKIDINVDSTL